MTGMRRLLTLLGLLLLLGGIAAAGLLLMLGQRYHDRQIDHLARAVVGCTTPLEFAETGTFYVYEEADSSSAGGSASCSASAAGGRFGYDLVGPDGRPVEVSDDRSVGYDHEGRAGVSLGRFEVTEPGTFAITVTGPVVESVAAIGRDPDDVVDTYRMWALMVGVSGVVLGTALLIVSAVTGRRPQPAAAAVVPEWPPTTPPVLDGLLDGPRGDAWAPPSGPPRGT